MKHTIKCIAISLIITTTASLSIIFALALCFAFAHLDISMLDPVNWGKVFRGFSAFMLLAATYAAIIVGIQASAERRND